MESQVLVVVLKQGSTRYTADTIEEIVAVEGVLKVRTLERFIQGALPEVAS